MLRVEFGRFGVPAAVEPITSWVWAAARIHHQSCRNAQGTQGKEHLSPGLIKSGSGHLDPDLLACQNNQSSSNRPITSPLRRMLFDQLHTVEGSKIDNHKNMFLAPILTRMDMYSSEYHFELNTNSTRLSLLVKFNHLHKGCVYKELSRSHVNPEDILGPDDWIFSSYDELNLLGPLNSRPPDQNDTDASKPCPFTQCIFVLCRIKPYTLYS